MGRHRWPLTRQTPLADPDGSRRGWAQSDPEELVETMETIYRNGAEVERRRVRAREVLQSEFTWRQFAEKLVAACEEEAEPQDATLWPRFGARGCDFALGCKSEGSNLVGGDASGASHLGDGAE